MLPNAIWQRSAKASRSWSACAVIRTALFPARSRWSIRISTRRPARCACGSNSPIRDLLLKPDMYADAEIATGAGNAVLAVPDSAVIDSGDRQIVLVDKGDGRFEPRAVQLGRRGDGYVEIRDGLKDGENVVTSANFLIDAESNLKSALHGLTNAGATP